MNSKNYNTSKHPCIVVGAGKMGLLHGALIEKSERGQVVGIVDISFNARMVVKGMGLNHPLHKFMNSAIKKFDGKGTCFICTQPNSHYSLAKSAIEYGWNVFVEKPLTANGYLSSELAKMLKERNVHGVVGYQKRFNPVFSKIKNLVAKDKKKIISINLQMLSPQFHGVNHQGSFRGGVEWDLMPHVMDLAVWFLDLVDVRKIQQIRSQKSKSGNINIKFNLDNIQVNLYADWSTVQVRKPEVRGKIGFLDGEFIEFDEDQIFNLVGDNFHRRNTDPVWFDVAEPDYSNQIISFFDLLDGEQSFNSTLESSSLVDLLIENALNQLEV